MRIEKSASDITLAWLDDQTLKIVLADNTTDKILLNPANNIPGLPCIFFGTFESDPTAEVSVSGCKDEDTEVSIDSGKIVGGLAELFLSDGKTSKVTLHNPTEKIFAKKNRTRRESELEPSLVILTWRKAKEIDVVFADGTKDKIHLQAVSNIPGEITPCLFTGSLDNDQDSEVTVVGCQGGSEVIVEILSEKEAGGLIELIIENGKTYEVKADESLSGVFGAVGPGDDLEGTADDVHVTDPEKVGELAAQIGTRQGRLPQSVTLEISLRYDLSLLEEFGNDHTQVKNWLYEVVRLAKPKMKMIGLQVNLEVVGTPELFNEWIEASNQWLERIHKTENRGKRGPISYFSAGNVQTIISSHNIIILKTISLFIQAKEMELLMLAQLVTPSQDTRSTSMKRQGVHAKDHLGIIIIIINLTIIKIKTD